VYCSMAMAMESDYVWAVEALDENGRLPPWGQRAGQRKCLTAMKQAQDRMELGVCERAV
jgi:hypothetical protein